MLKSSTGWLLTLCFLSIFSFLLVEVTAEVQDVQTLSDVLSEKVELTDISLSSNSAMYDRNGTLIADLYREENRIYLKYEEISKVIIDAFIATEDRRFFEHKGYDSIAIARALLANAKKGGIEEGASTMTQQLVRNLFLTHEQSYNRKMSEILYAHELEKHYSKEEIIELYLNTIYFHHGVYGIEAAATYYFNKKSEELTLAEVAFLGAIPNNPSHYDPINHSDRTKLRQEWILQKMVEASFITEDQYEQALAEEMILNVRKRIDTHPDYVTYIYHELTELVAATDGYDLKLKQASTDKAKLDIEQQLQERVQQLLAQGIRIETALDPIMQNRAIQTIEQQLPQSDVQSSVVMIDHQQAEIVAITGGKEYNKFDFHRAYQSFRQPGSALKPLLVYAPYFEEYDVPIQSTINANNLCKGDYCPRNFGGGQYGMVNLETAFKNSYNTPAVRILDRVGIETAFAYLEAFSFSRVLPEDYRLPSALGGFTYGMSPLEMTRAYTTFARNGAYTPSYGIRKVTDQEGNLLYSWEKDEVSVWSQATNDRMRQLLSAVIQSGTGQKAQVNARYAGGKTGTTNDYQDLWFVGLTDTYTTGVWVGKDTPASLDHLYSQAPHLIIWKNIQ